VSTQIRSRKGPLFSVEALPKPQLPETLQFSIKADNVDFLLPGNKPASFEVQLDNLSREKLETNVDFEVRDYLSHEIVMRSTNKITLQG